MKKIILVASAVLSLGMGPALAQGLPPGLVVYGSQASSNHPPKTGTIFSKIFGHSQSSQAAADRTVQRHVTSDRDS
jgi:hypothetical protein